MHAFLEGRESAVPHPRVQQMLRSIDDEVRAFSAEAAQRFVRDVSSKQEDETQKVSRKHAFLSAAKPFVEQVWPQERSLVTPGVSRAFADLPATATGAFAQAASAVERFIVPFDCWSMSDFGFSKEDEGGRLSLAAIETADDAAALLRLLDLAIGSGEKSVVPYDLPDALDRITVLSAGISSSPAFRRLATLARR
jgi:hypothetical protein